MERLKNYIWAIYLFFFIATVSTNTLAPVAFLILALWYFPKFNGITSKISETFINEVKKQASAKGKELEEKRIAFTTKVIVGFIVLFSFWITVPANNAPQTAQAPTQETAQQAEVKKTYTPEQIKASKELIEGLKGSDIGLISKIYEGDKGYWRVVIDEAVWRNLPYENKKQMLVALKIYIENVEGGTVKAIWGLGAHDNLLYFSEDSIYSEPRKLL